MGVDDGGGKETGKGEAVRHTLDENASGTEGRRSDVLAGVPVDDDADGEVEGGNECL